MEGIAADEALHVLAPQQGDVLAVAPPEEFHQAVPVPVFLLAHRVQIGGRPRIVGPQQPGKFLQDAGVFLFQGDGQAEHFRGSQVFEAAGHGRGI